MKDIFLIAELLFKKTFGELSQHDEDKMNNWLASDDIHSEYIKDATLEDRIQKRLDIHFNIDRDKSWDKIQKQIPEFNTALKINFKQFIKYAAAIFIPIGIVLSGYYLTSKVEILQMEQVSRVESVMVKPKAYVKLENGELVELKDGESQIIPGNNYQLKKDSSNQMTYSLKADKTLKDQLAHKIHTIVTPKGGDYHIELNDGTKVWLNAMTEISYPLVFSQENREVKLACGEAYFEVAKDSKRPFIITTARSTVEVLGTQFNYRSYNDEKQDEVTLQEGSVKVMSSDDELIIEPGFQAVVNSSMQIVTSKVNTQIYSSWRLGKLEFHRMSLARITSNLQRWYDVEFEFDNQALKEIQFSGGVYKSESIDFILNLIEQTTDVKFIIKGDLISVERKKK